MQFLHKSVFAHCTSSIGVEDIILGHKNNIQVMIQRRKGSVKERTVLDVKTVKCVTMMKKQQYSEPYDISGTVKWAAK